MLCLLPLGLSAQKIDQRLTKLVNHVAQHRTKGLRPINAKAVNKNLVVDFNSDGTIRAFSAIATMNKGAQCPTAQLEQMGITVRYVVGDQAALVIPADKLMALEQIEEIRYVKADLMAQLMNAKARNDSKADIVGDKTKASAAGLPKAYTGNGVVLGIIDGGIDFNHAAFRNADGSTRIKKAYIYGSTTYKEYSSEDITLLTCDDTATSHGSHTSATAGGSETGNGMQGVAPEVDLVLCGLGPYMSTTNINDAMQHVFDYATSVNKPAVVSCSLGNIIGLHDGSNETAQFVASLTENGNKPGRAVVISAGNSGSKFQSVVRKFDNTTDEVKTILGATTYAYDPEKAVIYSSVYCLYADDYKDFDIQLKVVNLKTGELSDVGDQVQTLDGEPCEPKLFRYDDLTVTGDLAVTYYLINEEPFKMKDFDSRLALVVKAKTAGQTIKMACNSDHNEEPCFDAPNKPYYYDFASNGYTKGNSDFTGNIMICNDAVISVGAYVTTSSWTNYKGMSYKYNPSPVTGVEQVAGEISDFSSHCIDDNGKPRPTMIAPGMGLVSAGNNWDASYFKIYNADDDQPGVPDEGEPNKEFETLISSVEKNGRQNWYVLERGTSMSTPHAAGIIALWMQADPTLTTNNILEVLQATCRNDEFTTDATKIPSGNRVQAGLGKIDAVAGLQKILKTTAIETVEAGDHREGTPATMYRVDAPVYNMMGQRVNKNTRGLVIYKGKKYFNN